MTTTFIATLALLAAATAADAEPWHGVGSFPRGYRESGGYCADVGVTGTAIPIIPSGWADNVASRCGRRADVAVTERRFLAAANTTVVVISPRGVSWPSSEIVQLD